MKKLNELDENIAQFKINEKTGADDIVKFEKELSRSSIIIIDHRNLFCKCLYLCLEKAFPNDRLASFLSVDSLFKSNIKHLEGDVIILYCDSHQNLQRKAARDELLLRVAHGIHVILMCEGDDIRDVMGCLDDGVQGYIPTNVSLQVSIEAIRLVRAGGIFIPANSLLQSYSSASDPDPPRQFTPRQTDVLGQLQKGKSNKIIAFELNMKESTVKVHVRNIMRRLGVTNRTEAVVEMRQNSKFD